MKTKRTQLSLIIPVYNEEKTLKSGLEMIHEYLESVPYLDNFEVIVINNGSTDKTNIILNASHKKRPKIKPIYLKKRGLGLALKKGLMGASFDAVMYVSIDLGFGVDFIEKSIAKYLEGYDLVLGSKGHVESVYDAPLERKLFSFFYNEITRLLFKVECRDTQGTFLISRKRFSEFASMLDSNGLFLQTQIVIYATKFKARIAELPVVYKASRRKSKIKISDAFLAVLELLKEYPKYRCR